MTAITVSVVIAAFEAAETIATALESLRRQTFSDWEAVVVDDGSTDSTARRVLRMADKEPRLRLVRQANAGVCRARNAGLVAARGELVLFLDADDWIEPDHLETMVAAQRRTGAQVVYCGYRRVTPGGERLPTSFSREIEAAPFRALAQHCFVAIHCVLAGRDLVVGAGGFDTNLRTCEDWDLWQRLARAGARFVAVDRPLALYRMRSGSLSNDFVAMARDGLTVLRRGAGRDERLAASHPEHRDGFAEHAEAAAAYFTVWCAAAAAAAGGDPDLVLREHPSLGAFPLAAEGLRTVLHEAVLVGAGAADREAARAWSEAAPRLRALLEVLDAAVPPSDRGFVHVFETELARQDPLRTSLKLLTVHAEHVEVGAFRAVEPAPGVRLLRLCVQAGDSPLWTFEGAAWGSLSARDVATLVLDQLGPAEVFKKGRYQRRWRFYAALGQSLPGAILRALIQGFAPRQWRVILGDARRRALLGLVPDTVEGRRAAEALRGLKQGTGETASPAPAVAPLKVEPATADASDWERVFEQEDPWGYATPYETLKYQQTLDLLEGRRFGSALEAGCAEGRFTQALAIQVDRLAAVDISATALERARRRCAGRDNVTFSRIDIASEPLPTGLDLIVCSEILYYLRDVDELARVAAKLRDSLAPNGRLVAAHAFVCTDSPSRTAFDWGSPFGAETITSAFAQTMGLVLERSLETELYRIDLWRSGGPSDGPPQLTIAPLALPEPEVQRAVIWDGVAARLDDLCKTVSTFQVPVLMYHRVTDVCEAALARYVISPAVFESQLRLLRRHGFYAITSGQLNWYRERREPLPGRPVLISFDDGYRDFHDVAWPILKRNGLQAEVFVVTDRVGGVAAWDAAYGEPAPLMTWDQIVDLSAEGVAFGSHLATHQSASALSCPELLIEALGSRRTLEERLARPVVSLAAPFGALNTREAQVIGEAGFRLAYTTRPGLAGPSDPPLQLPRIEVWNGMPLIDFALAVGVA